MSTLITNPIPSALEEDDARLCSSLLTIWRVCCGITPDKALICCWIWFGLDTRP